MKYDGYDVKPWQGVVLDPPNVVFGADISDLRRNEGRTLSGFASIPERDAAVREWIERQETKPVIVEGPVVRDRIEARQANRRVCDMIFRIEEILQTVKAWPPKRTQYDDDANYEHAQRIHGERLRKVNDLISSYHRELRVVQGQLHRIEHGGS